MGEIYGTSGSYDMAEPRFFTEGYAYIGKDEQGYIREYAPEWAKQEFRQFLKFV